MQRYYLFYRQNYIYRRDEILPLTLYAKMVRVGSNNLRTGLVKFRESRHKLSVICENCPYTPDF